MTKLKATKTVQTTVEIEVPNYYVSDASPAGQVVDFLLKDHTHRGETIRDWLFRDNCADVEIAIRHLKEAYAKAIQIAHIYGVTLIEYDGGPQ